ATVAARAAARSGRRAPWGTIALFLAPAGLLYLGFTLLPFLTTFYNSVHVLRMDLGLSAQFVGLQHYRDLLTDHDTFRLAVAHSVEWAVASFFLEVPIAFVLALILSRGLLGSRFFRTAWFTPVLITAPVVSIVWLWIYNYDWGVINVLLRATGL